MKLVSTLYSTAAALAVVFGFSPDSSAQSILKTAGNYSALASQGITVAGTGFSIKGGNIGLFPAATSNITGFPPGTVSGLNLLGLASGIISTGGANQQAEADLQVAATGLAALPMTANYSNVDMANLGPLPPGVYKWNAAATLTGALVLDAQGQNNVAWVFQFGTGLTTAVNSTVTVINAGTNGGSDDGIFWNAATGAIVIGDDNTVLGNYIAYTSVSFSGSTSLLGNGGARFLALNAAVTFAGPGTLNALGGPAGGDWTGGVIDGPGGVVIQSQPAGSPVFSNPVAVTVAAGTAFGPFNVAASGQPTVYAAVGLPPGLTIDPQTGVITGSATVTGTFVVTLTATNSVGMSSSTLTITVQQPYSRISNFSARAISGVGSDTLIVGFVVSGNGKALLVRGVGPTLANFGISSPLSDPVLALDSSTGLVATNSAWQTNSSGQDQTSLINATDAQVGAFSLTTGSADSALVATVNQGTYTTSILSPNGSSGVALTEIYDADTAAMPAARLINVSARMNVTPGQGVLIAGFYIAGNTPKTVLIRGIGPALTAFGVPGVLADPQITVFSGPTQMSTDAGWSTGPSSAAAITSASAQAGAFPLPAGSKDSALLMVLQPGAYTARVTSASGATGVALVEIYDTE